MMSHGKLQLNIHTDHLVFKLKHSKILFRTQNVLVFFTLTLKREPPNIIKTSNLNTRKITVKNTWSVNWVEICFERQKLLIELENQDPLIDNQ